MAGQRLVLVNIYALNIVSPDFFQDFSSLLGRVDADLVVMGGDLNMIIDLLLYSTGTAPSIKL